MEFLKIFLRKCRYFINRPIMKRLDELETINNNLVFLINQTVDINNVKTRASIKDIQDGQFKVLRKFDAFMKAIDAEYFLMYGTLIGILRTNSFVPWDDDIDTGMFHEDFHKILENEDRLKEFGLGLSSPFTKENNFKFTGWHKFFDLETMHTVSLFLYDIVNTKNANKILKIKTKYNKLAIKERTKFRDGEFDFKTLKNKLNELNKTYFTKLEFTTKKDATEDSYFVPNITNFNSPRVSKYKYVFPLQRTEFSVLKNTDPKMMVPIPNNPEKIITDIYGKDYMHFPNKIFPSHTHNHYIH